MKSLRLWWWHRSGRARAQKRLGAHLIDTRTNGRVVVPIVGHDEPRKHDGLPLHAHGAPLEWPLAIWPGAWPQGEGFK